MNKDIDCAVVKDLLPLYYDKVVSEKTEAIIREHLKNCKNCKSEYEKMFGNLPVENDTTNTQSKFIYTMKKQKKKTFIKIFVSVILAFFVVLGGCAIEHYWGDNIYAFFAFSDSEIMKVNENTYRVPKDNFEVFHEYMIKHGWKYTDQLGSVYIYENERQTAECFIEFKEFYAEYKITYTDKIVPSSALIDIYAKSLYNRNYKDGMITYSNDSSESEMKLTWTVAWYQDNKTPKMENAKIVVKDGDQLLYSKIIEIKTISNKDDYIHHGWNSYILIEPLFSVACKNPNSPEAYIIFTDSNHVEYKVCLEPTQMNIDTPNDVSNEIIITDENATYSYWDYLDGYNTD